MIAASAASRRRIASSRSRGTGSDTVRSGDQGSKVEWCSDENTTTVVSAGSTRASSPHESVVLRVKTTWSSGRAPMKRATSSRACSYHALVTRLA